MSDTDLTKINNNTRYVGDEIKELFKTVFEDYLKKGGDVEKLKKLIDTTDFIPNTIDKIILDFSEKDFKTIMQRRKQNLAIIREDMQGFERRLNRLWEDPFELFETLIYLSQEICEEISVKVRKNNRGKTDILFETIFRLHCRACQIAQEILKLMQTGFPDGAIARWRTLHEITVVSYFIKKNGPDIAEKFLLHDAIESYNSIEKYLRNPDLYQKHQRYLNNLLPAVEEMEDLKKIKNKLCEKYGPEFEKEYGWAANIIVDPRIEGMTLKNPTFANIEKDVKLDHLRPFYKMANISIHSGAKGINFHLTSPNKKFVPAGPGNMGMADPGQLAAISLFQMDIILLSMYPDIQALADSTALSKLLEEIKISFIKVERVTIDEYDEVNNKNKIQH